MWQRLQSGIRRLGSTWTDDDLANPQLNAPLIKVGNTWRVEKIPDLRPTALNAALANGAALIIYTVTAGTIPVLYEFSVSAGVGALFQLRYNAITFLNAICPVNATVVVSLPKATVFPTTGAVFDVVNNSGGVSAFAGSLVLSEYTP